jgi:hypothetical protein
MLGNEDSGYLLKVSITNVSTTDYGSDKIVFTNVFNTEETFTSTQSAEGTGSATIGGKVYSLRYYANDVNTQDTWNISIDYPDTTGGSLVLYPTLQTSKGAKVFFYEPVMALNINANLIAGTTAPVASLKFPNGNGYTEAVLTSVGATNATEDGWWTVNVGGTSQGTLKTNVSTNSVNVSVGQLKYTLYGHGTKNLTNVYLTDPATGANISRPAFGLIEEKDDNSQYQAMVVTTLPGTSSTNSTRVDTVPRSWDDLSTLTTLASNSNKQAGIDLFGTTVKKDSGDSNHPKIELSYPNEQIYANAYVTKEDSVVTPGGGSTPGVGGLTAVEDSLIASYQDKNLIVVGGSCVNKVAAKILGSEDPVCGADFTAKVNVAAAQYVIKTVASPYNEDKIAVLVAGYEAADTISAVDTLLAGASTDVGTSKVYPELATA